MGITLIAQLARDKRPGCLDPSGGSSYLTGMAVRPILTVPNPVLKQVSPPVDVVDDDEHHGHRTRRGACRRLVVEVDDHHERRRNAALARGRQTDAQRRKRL